MVYQGIIESATPNDPAWIIWLVAAMLGSALTLASFVKVLHATFLCKPAPGVSERRVREAPAAMTIPMVVLAVLCILFGVFASAVPLRWLVFPVAPAQVAGVWWAGLATVLILIAVAAGAIVYGLTLRRGKLRRCETYVGGENLDEVYLHGEVLGQSRHVEVTGVDFYRTIEQLPGLARLYALVRIKALDIYDLGAACGSYFVWLLRRAHSGALPVYLTWFLLGILAVLYVISPLEAPP
jgi:NADH:ubiquinone oxidoreductase subunit 5 (subunit L)/multisubunit Na+/H+ antiporter MnhA subunit